MSSSTSAWRSSPSSPSWSAEFSSRSGGVDLDAAAAVLGRVHRDVGAAQQRGAVDAVRRAHRDAEREVHLETDRVDRDRVGDAGADAAGDLERLLLTHVEDDDRELVAAEAGDAVPGPDAGLQALGEVHQQRVPDLVAEGVVDALEVVEVDQHQREPRALACVVGERGLELEAQGGAVRQPGQRVVPGRVLALERELGGVVEQQQRDQQQRHELPVLDADDEDERREREHRERHQRVVPEVLEDAAPERVAPGEHAGDEHEVEREVGDPGADHPAQEADVERGQRMRQRHVVGRGGDDEVRPTGGDRVLGRVEEGLPPVLARPQVGGQRADGDHQDRRPRPPDEHDRADERGRHDHALRVVPPALDEREQFEQDGQRGGHREGRREGDAPGGGDLEHGRPDQHPPDDDGEVPRDARDRDRPQGEVVLAVHGVVRARGSTAAARTPAAPRASTVRGGGTVRINQFPRSVAGPAGAGERRNCSLA